MNAKFKNLISTVFPLIGIVIITVLINKDILEFFNTSILYMCVVSIFAIQWICFIPSYIYQTENYFDLTGSITYVGISITIIILNNNLDFRTLLIGLLVIIWALRLGFFLFYRIQKKGFDSRFKEITPDFFRLLMTWTLQGVWIFLTFSAGLVAMSSTQKTPIDIYLIAGLLIWIIGFSIEIIADRQKQIFRSNPDNKNTFITSGLWSWSRHPNYFGEIILWIGIFTISIRVLSGWHYLTFISPIFVFVLLTYISGIPLLEKAADAHWGTSSSYKIYRQNTSILIPFPPKKSN